MQPVLKKSDVKVFTRQSDEARVWQSGFCVLEAGRVPKLEVYASEVMWKTKGLSKTISIVDIESVKRGSDIYTGEAHVFELTYKVGLKNKSSESSVYAVESEKELDDWIEKIRELIDKGPSSYNSMPPTLAIPTQRTDPTHRTDPSHTLPHDLNCMVGNQNSFPASVHGSESAEKCSLSPEKAYILQVTPLNLLLLQMRGGIRVKMLAWPYKYIRRYGRSHHSFTFEAGRKCESGEGLFTFQVEDGEKIFKEVHKCTKAMKTRTSPDMGHNSTTAMSSSPPTPSILIMKTPPPTPTSPLSDAPTLPKRNYGNANEFKQQPQPQENKGSSSPNSSDRERPKKQDLLHNIKDAIKAPLKTFSDQISESLHRNRAFSDDVSPINSLEDDIHGSIGDIGTAGKYTSSPNMRQRGLPPIPTTDDNARRSSSGNADNNNYNKNNLEKKHSLSPRMAARGLPAIPTAGDRRPSKTVDNSEKPALMDSSSPEDIYHNPDNAEVCRTGSGRQHMYSLYDDSCHQAAGDMYEDKRSQLGVGDSSGYMLGTTSVSLAAATGNKDRTMVTNKCPSKDVEYVNTDSEDIHYSSIDEDKKPPVQEENYSDPRAFKMSELLTQTQTANKEVDKEQEDYATTYSQDYDSIDILKSVDKGGHTRPISNEVTDDSNEYGVLSLGPKRGKAIKKEVSYINTSTNRKS